jgi:hypothetical protein
MRTLCGTDVDLFGAVEGRRIVCFQEFNNVVGRKGWDAKESVRPSRSLMLTVKRSLITSRFCPWWASRRDLFSDWL